MNERWRRILIVAGGLFAINAISRFVTWKADIVSGTEQLRVALVATVVTALALAGLAAWAAPRYPFSRLAADLGAAAGIAIVLTMLVGPFAGGSVPFREGPEIFVYQVLLLIGIYAAGVGLGFMAVVALGKDWRSKGLKRYEATYKARPNRAVRG
jgi:hypothetical protein